MGEIKSRPRIANAPGLVWKPRRNGWEARWRARADKVAAGFTPKSAPLWRGRGEPTDAERKWISDQCTRLQNEMLAWGREVPETVAFDGTLGGLIHAYQSDPVSPIHALRYHSRKKRIENVCRIAREKGKTTLADIRKKTLLLWHREWVGPHNHIVMAHHLIGALRVVLSFGADVLEDEQSERLCGALHRSRFKMGKKRQEKITAAQAAGVCAEAHAMDLHSIALAQAFQFDLMLRQKDVIGEWVPMNEPGISDVTNGQDKWLVGLRWEEIDENWILRHTTSKRDKDLPADLKLAPMVMDELARLWPNIPTSGPVIVEERTGLPYIRFRQKWRIVARRAGVPANVKNMDSRAGGASEADESGAYIEDIQGAMTHGDSRTTRGYIRGGEERKVNKVLQIRAAHRNRTKTD